MINIKDLKKTLAESTYKDLVEFLTIRLNELKNIENVQEYSKAQDQAVELKAQKKAYKKLSQILSEIITTHDIPEIPKAEGNDYGVEE